MNKRFPQHFCWFKGHKAPGIFSIWSGRTSWLGDLFSVHRFDGSWVWLVKALLSCDTWFIFQLTVGDQLVGWTSWIWQSWVLAKSGPHSEVLAQVSRIKDCCKVVLFITVFEWLSYKVPGLPGPERIKYLWSNMLALPSGEHCLTFFWNALQSIIHDRVCTSRQMIGEHASGWISIGAYILIHPGDGWWWEGVGEVWISKGKTEEGACWCPGPGDTYFPLAAQQQQQ